MLFKGLAAGVERKGDVIEIHWPYVGPKQYAELTADHAQAIYYGLEGQNFSKQNGNR